MSTNNFKSSSWDFSDSIHTIKFEPKPVIKDISIIIPTLGRLILEECLINIILGTHWPESIIIVHQGDEPYIKEWVELINGKGIVSVYIHSAERGKPAAINVAFSNTHTKFFCMIDDDCFVEPDWLRNMYARLQKNPDWIITGRVEPAGNEKVAVVQSLESSIQFRPKLKFDLFVGGNMGAAIEVVRQIGLFDEDPLLRNAAEDVEWGYRALRKRIPIVYAPEVAVSHFGWRDEIQKNDRFKVYAYGHGSFYGKYLRQGDLFILARAAGHFLRALRRWIRGRMRGDPELALLGKSYCLNMLPGILAGIRSKVKPGELK